MKEIVVLDQLTIDKIAAGEVVERPASVVKELVENAIDAGASSITVEIKDGGISFIRITDNGMGIEKDQVRTAFLRHATSKIRQVEDLQSIASLGFRGEALSSIAAVSQVELITKTPQAFMGVRYEIQGGVEKSYEEIGAPNGTTFLIRNLFYNTPARSKFLKKPATEAGYISAYIEQLSVSHPNVSFKFLVNGQNKLHTPGNGNLKDVIYQVFGREITKELLPINYQDPQIQITGFIGRPMVCRGNRNHENYYVNGRYVKSKTINRAIEDGYKNFMMQHKYPFTAFSIEVTPSSLDVNVHPTKMEVRFSDNLVIYDGVYQAIHNALAGKPLIPEVELTNNGNISTNKTKKDSSNDKEKEKCVPEPFEIVRKALEKEKKTTFHDASVSNALRHEFKEYNEIKRFTDNQQNTGTLKSTLPQVLERYPIDSVLHDKKMSIMNTEDKSTVATNNTVLKESVPNNIEASVQTTKFDMVRESSPYEKNLQYGEQRQLFDGELLNKKAKNSHVILGQLFQTYWLVEMNDKLFIIDQHAAHEKVLYERLVKDFKNKEILSQMVSPPIIVTLSLQEIQIYEKYKQIFEDFGFDIAPFGGKEYAINAIPSHLVGLIKGNLFLDILDQLTEDLKGKTQDALSEKLASMACKAAIKGNQTISTGEIKSLINELLTLENPYNCPHGRPTIISMTKYELEKKFKRIL